MLNISNFASGKDDMETCLLKQGLTAGIYSQFADTARRDIRFLSMMNLITDEEAQTIFNRTIAMIGRVIDEIH